MGFLRHSHQERAALGPGRRLYRRELGANDGSSPTPLDRSNVKGFNELAKISDLSSPMSSDEREGDGEGEEEGEGKRGK